MSRLARRPVPRLVPAAVAFALLASSLADEAAGRRRKARSPEVSSAQEAQKHYRFGYQFYTQGFLRQAEEELQRALSIQPSYPEATYVLGLVKLELNDYHAVIELASSALEQNPFFTEAHNLMGLAYARMGRYQDALRSFEAVKADINYPTPEVAHYNIGRIFAERGACGEALIDCRRALEINPKFGKAWFLMGDCQEQIGQLPEARRSLEKALENLPDAPDVHYRLGYVCFLMVDWACARLHFDWVLLNAPSSQMAEGAREFKSQMDFR